jgi:hypothetical protein
MFLTVIMGGGVALLAGRSLAKGWRPLWKLFLYMLPFTAALRFLHFALFGAELTSVQYFLSHGLVVTAFAFLGYRMQRTSQMTSQYPWLYERTSPFSWSDKA